MMRVTDRWGRAGGMVRRGLVVLSLASLLAIPAMTAHATTGTSISFNSALQTSDPTYTDTQGSGQTVYYRTFQYTVPGSGGSYANSVTCSFSCFVYLYQGAFLPSDPIANLWSADGGSSGTFTFPSQSMPSGTYILVVAGGGAGVHGSFSATVSGSPALEMDPITSLYTDSYDMTIGDTSATLLGGSGSNNGVDGTVVSFLWSATPGGPYTTVAADQSPLHGNASPPELTASISGLSPNTNYYFVIEASNASLGTIETTEDTFTTTGPPAPTATPTNTPVPTNTPTNTAVPTDTATPAPTNTPTNTNTPTTAPTNTNTPTTAPTNTPVPTNTPTHTATPAPTNTATQTPSPTPPIFIPTPPICFPFPPICFPPPPIFTPTPTAMPTNTPDATNTPTATLTPSPTPTSTATAAPATRPTVAPVVTATGTPVVAPPSPTATAVTVLHRTLPAPQPTPTRVITTFGRIDQRGSLRVPQGTWHGFALPLCVDASPATRVQASLILVRRDAGATWTRVVFRASMSGIADSHGRLCGSIPERYVPTTPTHGTLTVTTFGAHPVTLHMGIIAHDVDGVVTIRRG